MVSIKRQRVLKIEKPVVIVDAREDSLLKDKLKGFVSRERVFAILLGVSLIKGYLNKSRRWKNLLKNQYW